MRKAQAMLLLSLLGAGGAVQAEETWKVLMCGPAPACVGDCRPQALVRPQDAKVTMGCNVMGSYRNYEFARRSADSFNGMPPSLGGFESFGFSYTEAERLRGLNDWYGAQQLYRQALSRASTMDEVLLVAEALVAGGEVQAGVAALSRARDMAGSRETFTMVGDAFAKAGRPDQARLCYDKARDFGM